MAELTFYIGEQEKERGLSTAQRIYGNQRKYRGTLHSALQIIRVRSRLCVCIDSDLLFFLQHERLVGLYKGFVPALMREAMCEFDQTRQMDMCG